MRRAVSRVGWALAFGLCASAASAEMRVHDAWARLQPAGARMSAAFLVLENTGPEADALIGARCDCAESVELHVMQESGGQMTMRPVERFEVPAGGKFELAPGGPHLMLIGLTAPLATDKPIRVDLRFERSAEQKIEIPVRDPRPGAAK